MSKTNLVFRAPKTRRLVSAWTLKGCEAAMLRRVRQFDDLFDQIIFMCGSPKPDGSMPKTWPVEDRRRLTAKLAKMGVSVLNDYNAPNADLTPALLRACVAGMVQECLRSGADGVDIDFEHLPPECRFMFTDFVAELSAALHAEGKMLSLFGMMPTSSARREVGMGFIDPALLASHLDHFRIGCYDLFTPRSLFVGPTSAAPWGRDACQALLSCMPPHKVVMGLPTYSIDWDINQPKKSRQVNDAAFVARCEKKSPIGRGWMFWLDVNLIRYADRRGHAHLLYVSDARSTRSHLRTVDELDLEGVCFWCLTGTEDPRIYQALREYLRR